MSILSKGGLREALLDFVHNEKPVWGTCAGLILLSKGVPGRDSALEKLDALDVEVERNYYGRQLESFQGPIELTGALKSSHKDYQEVQEMVFIRAPGISKIGEGVHVLATRTTSSGTQQAVAVQQGNIIGTTFHPELSESWDWHHYFLHLTIQHSRQVTVT
uniref:Glutaminase n=1 Tax=Arcella intermedia TaxID=1963864 RepID=A0A6B2LNI3_9EUKA|eukprot:TRINITY_DN8567_c0_g1_i2.p1 TRINITY_DN8567_c0_g1~~TRINITY_DN8567_c0_g1_i2.p1  ORF type:complete len:161 (-),score=35.07 TRINITY_DN8567_c0_g1_i2:27-509(-)